MGVVVGDCEESVELQMCSCAVMMGSVRPCVSAVTGECGEIHGEDFPHRGSLYLKKHMSLRLNSHFQLSTHPSLRWLSLGEKYRCL